MLKDSKKLEKQLGAFDVFAIATGAMFSSGLFLLPGLAASETGASVFLAYLVSGLLIIPTMMSKAELARKAGLSTLTIDRVEVHRSEGDGEGEGGQGREGSAGHHGGLRGRGFPLCADAPQPREGRPAVPGGGERERRSVPP